VKRLRILIVDDEDLVRNALSRLLREHEIHHAGCGEEALELVEEGRYDGILCDLLMPRMDGLEFYQQLKRSDPDQAARLVFLTGSSGKPSSSLEGVRVIDKPIDLETLEELVEGWKS